MAWKDPLVYAAENTSTPSTPKLHQISIGRQCRSMKCEVSVLASSRWCESVAWRDRSCALVADELAELVLYSGALLWEGAEGADDHEHGD